MAAKKPDDLTGKWVRCANGNVYRVSLWPNSPTPYGVLNNDDKNESTEIPRPFTVLKGKP